jgi:hypothetical protein
MKSVIHKSSKVRLIVLCILILIISNSSCKKLVEVSAPVSSTNADNVYSSDATAIAVLNGIYIKLSQGGLFTGKTGISFYTGLSADELTLYSGASDIIQNSYYKNKLAVNTAGYEYWNSIYNYIFKCNAAIEGLSNSIALTPAVKQQLLGEAKFMRAFFYFYLVNLYGGVPLTLTTDFEVNRLLYRASKNQVYQQIISDLKEAQNLLSQNYLDGTLLSVSTERVRPTKWATTSLLARVYLYTGDWGNAETHATVIINNTAMHDTVALNNVFLKNSKETIWQLQPVIAGWNTEDAFLFIIPSTGFSSSANPIYISNFLLNSFEVGDNRKTSWTGKYIDTIPNPDVEYYYPYKYKSATQNAAVTEYPMLLRLGEQYLIRAEARAQQGNVGGSKTDLNIIRIRARLTNTTAATQSALLTAILQERQVELFTELGHRWLDLKRSNTVDAVMSIVTPLKGGTWSPNWQWYPVSGNDIERNPNLTQSVGY